MDGPLSSQGARPGINRSSLDSCLMGNFEWHKSLADKPKWEWSYVSLMIVRILVVGGWVVTIWGSPVGYCPSPLSRSSQLEANFRDTQSWHLTPSSHPAANCQSRYCRNPAKHSPIPFSFPFICWSINDADDMDNMKQFWILWLILWTNYLSIFKDKWSEIWINHSG